MLTWSTNIKKQLIAWPRHIFFLMFSSLACVTFNLLYQHITRLNWNRYEKIYWQFYQRENTLIRDRSNWWQIAFQQRPPFCFEVVAHVTKLTYIQTPNILSCFASCSISFCSLACLVLVFDWLSSSQISVQTNRNTRQYNIQFNQWFIYQQEEDACSVRIYELHMEKPIAYKASRNY